MESTKKIRKGQLELDHKLDKDFSTLTAATTPLTGTEEIAIVQGGETKKVAVSNVGGGGGSQNLQQVTDVGNVTTNNIIVDGIDTRYVRLTDGAFETEIKAEGLTDSHELFVPDENGTIATREWANATKLDKVTTVDEDKAYIKLADGTQAMKPLSEIGGSSETFEQSRWMFNDFYSSNTPLNREPYLGVAFNGGSSGVASLIVIILSGTSANGGFRYITNNNTITNKQGLTFFGIINLFPDSSARDRVIRMGFHTATTNVAPVNGTFVEITGSDLVFITRNTSVDTTSSSITLANGAANLYEVLIYFTTATDVRCIVKEQGGAVVLDTNSTTNIPTVGLNAGIISHIVTAGTNHTINGIDYMGLGQVCPTFLQDRL